MKVAEFHFKNCVKIPRARASKKVTARTTGLEIAPPYRHTHQNLLQEEEKEREIGLKHP